MTVIFVKIQEQPAWCRQTENIRGFLSFFVNWGRGGGNLTPPPFIYFKCCFFQFRIAKMELDPKVKLSGLFGTWVRVSGGCRAGGGARFCQLIIMSH